MRACRHNRGTQAAPFARAISGRLADLPLTHLELTLHASLILACAPDLIPSLAQGLIEPQNDLFVRTVGKKQYEENNQNWISF